MRSAMLARMRCGSEMKSKGFQVCVYEFCAPFYEEIGLNKAKRTRVANIHHRSRQSKGVHTTNFVSTTLSLPAQY